MLRAHLNALKPFSVMGLHPWPHTGGGVYPRPPQEYVLYKMPQEGACEPSLIAY